MAKTFKAKIVVNATVEVDVPVLPNGRVADLDKVYSIDDIMDLVYDEAEVNWSNVRIIGYTE